MKKSVTLSKEVVALLLPRLADEFKAFYFYRSATNWCKNQGFNKAAEYFAEESKSELEHAKKHEDFLTDWNVMPYLPVVASPVCDFKDLGDVITQAYDMEYALYEEYEATSSLIFKSTDLCVFDFLEFYRTTQRQSVAEYSDMVGLLDGIDPSDKFQMVQLQNYLF